MNINKKRHRLLEILAEPLLKPRIQGEKRKFDFFLEGNEGLLKKLKCTEYKFKIIVSVLLDLDEVRVLNPYKNRPEYSIGNFGLAAFSNEKYLKIHRDNNWQKVKNIALIISVIIAIATISIKVKDINTINHNKFEKIEKNIKLIESEIDEIKNLDSINFKNKVIE